MSNLRHFREIVGLTNAQIGHTLLIRATSYMRMEKYDKEIDPLTSAMLAKAYGIDSTQFICVPEEITHKTISTLQSLAALPLEKRLSIMMQNLSDGRFDKASYRVVNIVKEEFRKKLEENSPQE